MKAIWAIAICILAGCSPTKVEPLALLQGQKTAKIRSNRDLPNHADTEVFVDDLTYILARATWVDSSPFHKGGHWITFRCGKEVLIPYAYEFVIVRDTKGHFVIRDEDTKRYKELAQRIHNKANRVGERF